LLAVPADRPAGTVVDRGVEAYRTAVYLRYVNTLMSAETIDESARITTDQNSADAR
jgi:hypothetical protein